MSIFPNDFERIKYYYEQGWASKEQVGMYVYFNVITPEEYELIVGEPYEP